MTGPVAMHSRWWSAIPVIVVLAMIAVGLVVVARDEWRIGSTVLASAAGLAALMRLVLPQRAVGVLAVRSRIFDVAVFVALAALLAGMGLIAVTPQT